MSAERPSVVSLPPLPETVTIDEALGGKVRIAQPKNGFRFGTDSVVLASAVLTRPDIRILDLGTGTGIVGLCILARSERSEGIFVCGIDCESAMVDLARYNVAANEVQDRMHVSRAAVGQALVDQVGAALPDASFDVVVFNPPYFEPARHQRAEGQQRTMARQGDGQPLSEWFKAARRYLKPGGQVTMVIRAQVLDDVLSLLAVGFGQITIIPFWPKLGQAAKTVVVRATKGSRAPLLLTAGVVMHTPDGGHTDQATALLRTGLSLDHVLTGE